MSHSARDWVWERSRARGTARLVMLSLADHVTGPECLAYGSTTSLAERTGAGRRTVVTAVDRAIELGELEIVRGRTGPRGERVYRLPLAVGWTPGTVPTGGAADPAGVVEGCEICTTGGADSAQHRCENRTTDGAETAPRAAEACGNCTTGGAEFAGQRCSNCTTGSAETAPQNRREQKGKGTEREQRTGAREHTAASAARFTLPADWQPDDALIGWAGVTGHLQRLGIDGIDRATAKWLAHRAAAPARTAEQWRSDWQHWISRERATPPLHVVPGSGTAGGTSRTARNSELLQAALAELNSRGGNAG
ncbi:helix-turn-helix domain-containing protein [Kitasatospora mediocidica]|uniref:helix-turn-helix domain-containing protein n=1 Tax=Kitasatospora mediocidica TaxID=58352 RepID=UPI00056090AA|nr:helix-turn-helix domain-containing protein [Kitasatospora mediocidica]